MLMTQAMPLTLGAASEPASRGALEWLLGLDQLRAGGETLELGWRVPFRRRFC